MYYKYYLNNYEILLSSKCFLLFYKLNLICLLIRNQRDLEWLYLEDNRIKTLDGELPIDNNKLMVLNVSNNSLVHLPPELDCLVALRYFYCTSNQLTSLNKTLSNLKKLVWLELTGNRIQEV